MLGTPLGRMPATARPPPWADTCSAPVACSWRRHPLQAHLPLCPAAGTPSEPVSVGGAGLDRGLAGAAVSFRVSTSGSAPSDTGAALPAEPHLESPVPTWVLPLLPGSAGRPGCVPRRRGLGERRLAPGPCGTGKTGVLGMGKRGLATGKMGGSGDKEGGPGDGEGRSLGTGMEGLGTGKPGAESGLQGRPRTCRRPQPEQHSRCGSLWDVGLCCPPRPVAA